MTDTCFRFSVSSFMYRNDGVIMTVVLQFGAKFDEICGFHPSVLVEGNTHSHSSAVGPSVV